MVDSQRGERHCGNQGGRSRWLGRFSYHACDEFVCSENLFFIGRLNVKQLWKPGGQKQMARPILLLNRLLLLICELFENGNDCDFLWKEQRSQFNKVLLLLVNFYGENGNEFV